MPSGVSFIQLEGNYVISFRDMSEALPAFTAVKLDRRRASWDGAMVASNLSSSALRASVSVEGSPRGGSPGGSLAGSKANLGDDLAAVPGPGQALQQARRRSSAAASPYKLVLTGIPRCVREDLIRSRLEVCIPGIERVYRDQDMARELTHPPVFVETRLAMAQDAFMLRADWVPVVQRLIRQANKPAASEDEGIGSFTLESEAQEDEEEGEKKARSEEERQRRQALVDTLVACPHGRYNPKANCLICRNAQRRNTMLADDIVGHNLAASLPALAMLGGKGAATRDAPTNDRPPPPAKTKSSCTSCLACLACLRRLVPRRLQPRRPAPEDEEDEETTPPAMRPAAQPAPPSSQLDHNRLLSVKSMRRMSAYGDVPVIEVSVVGDVK